MPKEIPDDIYKHYYQPVRTEGQASGNGTASYFYSLQKHRKNVSSRRFCTEVTEFKWTVSRAGLGTYRFFPDHTEHRGALIESLLSGINVIDTAPNFADGGAEYLTGDVLRELINLKEIQRENVVLISKCGMIQGRLLKYLKELTDTYDFRLISPNLGYCLNPDFIDDQLSLSMKRLGVSVIDVYLIQNPEYLLSYYDTETFYNLIRTVLEKLETLREEGRIQVYGIASNNFFGRQSSDCIDLEKILSFAPPGFQVIEFPANLAETDFLNMPALSRTLWKISQRPFNAIVKRDSGQELIRLAAMTPYIPSEETFRHLNEKKESLRSLDQQIVQRHKESYFRFEHSFPSLLDLLNPFFSPDVSPESYPLLIQETMQRMANTFYRIQLLNEISNEDPLSRHWYSVMNQILRHLDLLIRARAFEKIISLEKNLKNIYGPDISHGIAGIGLLWLKSNPQIDTVLCGARNIFYIQDILNAFEKPVPDPEKQKLIAGKVREFLLRE